MTKSNIIQFPGVRSTRAAPMQPEGALAPPSRVDYEKPSRPEMIPAQVSDPNGKIVQLTEDQQKAIAAILSGLPFVFIGIRPTDRGADFITALDGPAEDLRNAYDHLNDVIARLYSRKGIHS
jgi:hypothetical protein